MFLTQDALAGHILAVHMRQASWPPLKLEEGTAEDGTEAPDAFVEVTATAEGDDQVTNMSSQMPFGLRKPPATAVNMFQRTMESQICINSPSSSAQKFVTLIHPVEQEVVIGDGEQLPTTEVLSSVGEHHASLEPATQHLAHHEAAANENTEVSTKEEEEETMVTFTDPNTNQEYMVAMPPGALESLLAVTELQTGTELHVNMGQEVVTAAENLQPGSDDDDHHHDGATTQVIETEVPLSGYQVEEIQSEVREESPLLVVKTELEVPTLCTDAHEHVATTYTAQEDGLLIANGDEPLSETVEETAVLETSVVTGSSLEEQVVQCDVIVESSMEICE